LKIGDVVVYKTNIPKSGVMIYFLGIIIYLI